MTIVMPKRRDMAEKKKAINLKLPSLPLHTHTHTHSLLPLSLSPVWSVERYISINPNEGKTKTLRILRIFSDEALKHMKSFNSLPLDSGKGQSLLTSAKENNKSLLLSSLNLMTNKSVTLFPKF